MDDAGAMGDDERAGDLRAPKVRAWRSGSRPRRSRDASVSPSSSSMTR